VLVVQSELGHTRAVSSPVNCRPTSYHSEGEGGGSNAISKLRRRSWMPGGSGGRRSRSSSRDNDEHAPIAWVNAAGRKIDYNINLLLAGEKVSFLRRHTSPAFSRLTRCLKCGTKPAIHMYIYSLENPVVDPRSKSHRCASRRRTSSIFFTVIYTLVEHTGRVSMTGKVYLSKILRDTSLFEILRPHRTLPACPRESRYLTALQNL
jgi:hypothetical protein